MDWCCIFWTFWQSNINSTKIIIFFMHNKKEAKTMHLILFTNNNTNIWSNVLIELFNNFLFYVEIYQFEMALHAFKKCHCSIYKKCRLWFFLCFDYYALIWNEEISFEAGQWMSLLCKRSLNFEKNKFQRPLYRYYSLNLYYLSFENVLGFYRIILEYLYNLWNRWC